MFNSLYLQYQTSKLCGGIWITQKQYSKSEKFTSFSCSKINSNIYYSYSISQFAKSVTELLIQLSMADIASISVITFEISSMCLFDCPN